MGRDCSGNLDEMSICNGSPCPGIFLLYKHIKASVKDIFHNDVGDTLFPDFCFAKDEAILILSTSVCKHRSRTPKCLCLNAKLQPG